MKRYEELDNNSYGAILKKAREDYAKKNGIKFGQKQLAEYLGTGISSVGGWEQGRKNIPEEHFASINSLLGTNFKIDNDSYDNDLISFQATLYFYLGIYKFIYRQYEYIIAKLLTTYCENVLNKDEIKKYNKILDSIKKNNIFTENSKQKYIECISYIKKFLNSIYKKKKTKSGEDAYISRISDNVLTEKGVQKELYKLLTSLDSKKIIYEAYQNIPVYNSSGIIEFYEKLPPKFSDNKYEYVYCKIDNSKKKFPDKYVDGALALIRLGNFCFPNEDVIIQIGNTFSIEHINTKHDMELLKRDYAQWLIEDYTIIGAVMMIDYSTSTVNLPDYKITI